MPQWAAGDRTIRKPPLAHTGHTAAVFRPDRRPDGRPARALRLDRLSGPGSRLLGVCPKKVIDPNA